MTRPANKMQVQDMQTKSKASMYTYQLATSIRTAVSFFLFLWGNMARHTSKKQVEGIELRSKGQAYKWGSYENTTNKDKYLPMQAPAKRHVREHLQWETSICKDERATSSHKDNWSTRIMNAQRNYLQIAHKDSPIPTAAMQKQCKHVHYKYKHPWCECNTQSCAM